jgi:hypothetical protein
MMFARVLAVMPIIALVAVPVMAADVDARGSARADGWYNSEENEIVTDGRIDFDVDVGSVTFGGTYRAYDFGDGDYNPRGISPFYGVKHRYVEVRTNGLWVRGGDFFATFGRGLTLRSFESIDLEYDTSLDGFISEYDVGPLEVAGFAGRLDETVTDTRSVVHRLRGGRARVRLGSRVALAASGVRRNTDIEDETVVLTPDLSRFNDHVVGAETETWLGPVSLAGEYAVRRGDYYSELRQGDVEGHGTYLTGSASTSWSTLLAEYKDYYRFEDALVSPPTCVKEHVWILMNRVTHEIDLGNERGFLIEGTLTPVEDIQVDGGASEARTRDGSLIHWEIFGQIDTPRPLWGVSGLAGSWSREYVRDRFTEYMTGAVGLEYAAGPLRALDIDVEIQRTEEPSGEAFENYLASAACYPRHGLTLSVVGEATSRRGLKRDSWLSGDLRVAVAEGVEVSLGGGTERGGKKCSGGICFTEPEFTGVRLRVLTYF